MKLNKIVNIATIIVLSFSFLGCMDDKSSNTSTKKVSKEVRITPSTLRGVTPLKVDFHIDEGDKKIVSYYFSFDGKENIKNKIDNDSISYTFKNSGKHKVKIALKHFNGEITKKDFIIESRDMNFNEYKKQQNEEFEKFKSQS